MPARGASRTKLLLLDFDGTVCLGDDPVLVYASQVETMLTERGSRSRAPGGHRGGVRDVVADALFRGDLRLPELRQDHHDPVPPQDGYQLVQLLARRAGISDDDVGLAFRAARRDLLDIGLEATDIHAPADLAALLARVRRTTVVVLVTNAPAVDFTGWLQALGLSESFDAVINDARKPLGMPDALRRARAVEDADMPVAADRILSVGDIWHNDLEPVAAAGGATALIDRFSAGVGHPTWRVDDFAGAAKIIDRWWNST